MLDYEVEQDEAGNRLDVLITNIYPQFSRSSLELLFDKNMVMINDKVAKAAYKVRGGDAVTIDETYLKQAPPPIDLPIIYEDENVVVIDKPAGLLTHSKGALNLEPSVASFIKDKLTDQNLAGNRAGIVHRLDRGTSGVIITAKTVAAQQYLQKQFSQRKVKKTYRAIVEGSLDPQEALIDAPIGRNPENPQTFKVMASGKFAITHYKVLKEFKKNGQNYSELELRPQTGRTHQLRVHLAYIGHPIVGDYVYGHNHNNQPILLHAASLELTLPNKQRHIFESPLPKKYRGFIDE